MSILGRLVPIFAAAVLASTALAAESKNADSGGSGISAFSLGAGVSVPIGNDYVTLGNAASYQGDLLVHVASLGPSMPLRFSGFFTPFSVKDLPNSTANVDFIGILGGVEFRSPGGEGKIAPYFAAQVGGDYEFLVFSNSATGNSQNATINFAARLTPGLEIPFTPGFSLTAELPVTTFIGKRTTLLGGAAGTLRFRL